MELGEFLAEYLQDFLDLLLTSGNTGFFFIVWWLLKDIFQRSTTIYGRSLSEHVPLFAPCASQRFDFEAHQLLVCFCTKFQEMYETTSCTINMHLSCHLHQCLQDFGPSHTFWCFGFERMNGILGSLNTNSHLVEIELTLATNDTFMCHNT